MHNGIGKRQWHTHSMRLFVHKFWKLQKVIPVLRRGFCRFGGHFSGALHNCDVSKRQKSIGHWSSHNSVIFTISCEWHFIKAMMFTNTKYIAVQFHVIYFLVVNHKWHLLQLARGPWNEIKIYITSVAIKFSFLTFSLNSVTKILFVRKIIRTCHLLCKRLRCYHNASKKTQVGERIFKLSPIHASVIYQIPCVHWIHWISDPFRENSNESNDIPTMYNTFTHVSMYRYI